jgi:GTP-binding protein EngB required for normal cell division
MKKAISDILSGIESATGLDLGSVRQEITEEQRRPLSAAVFGQTGCGKSSLTNAIFGTSFDVDDVRPCTKEPQAHDGVDSEGNKIVFWDLPGIGESVEADRRYLDMYTKYAADCDVVLWAFQADTRTMTLDAAALDAIVERLEVGKRGEFLSRLAIVITKADVVTSGPWVFAKSDSEAVVATSKEVEDTLERKASYFFDGLLGKYKGELIHRTFVSSKTRHLSALPSEFRLDERKAFIHHKGALDKAQWFSLIERHPNCKDELKRLQQQSCAVYCSARLKFNLSAVKAQIAQKGRGTSVLRLHQSVDREDAPLAWKDLKTLGLPVFWDKDQNLAIFNISEL